MKRAYLEEDLALVQKYFPGARAVTMRVPFELTHGRTSGQSDAPRDSFRDDTSAADAPQNRWLGDIVWMN